ncbi:pyridoxamine 5'-phosphate oxidase family protein [Tessaracoccus sp. OH4464_COT-324]|uniref:pyridoxamine 5'-phosphate oxidase family protein n=1 Tax=Tessaracoccus sp. OH4464_COT-324 TaxID=2491059 RepID=UPI00131A178E|nr:pyridoxamine 5'-phosphate oxidase family protein [Tessaracoccus sp. OH4464_COT-324]
MYEDETYFVRLSAQECLELLGDADVGRVAWLAQEGIVVVPVNYQLVDDRIIFHTAEGSPLMEVTGQRVSFQVDDIDCESAVGWTVLVKGSAQVAEGEFPSVTWLDDGRKIAVMIVPDQLSGRVISGVRRRRHERE